MYRGYAPTITVLTAKSLVVKVMNEVKQIGNAYQSKTRSNPNQGRIYDTDGISPALTTMGGGNRQPMVFEKTNNIRLNNLIDKAKFHEGQVMNLDIYNQTTNEDVSQTLTSPNHNSQALYDGARIRKLTPLETWRLQGQTDEAFYKARAVNSDTQLYKQAGNSICVDVLYYLMKAVLEQNEI